MFYYYHRNFAARLVFFRKVGDNMKNGADYKNKILEIVDGIYDDWILETIYTMLINLK